MPRSSRWVWVLLIVAVLLLWQRETIMFHGQLRTLLWLDSPVEDWAGKLASTDERRVTVVRALWNSAKVHHRRLAVDLLKGNVVRQKNLLEQCPDVMNGALQDEDYLLRELMLSAMDSNHHPLLRDSARAFLRDADPFIQSYAINILRKRGFTNTLHEVAALLGNSDPMVQVLAARTLEAFTGSDYDMEHGLAAQRSALSEAGFAQNQERTRAEMDRVRAWWSTNKSLWPVELSALEATPVQPARYLSPMTFVTSDEKSFSTAGLADKPVLLLFFVAYEVLCEELLAEVSKLQRRVGDRVKILGVSLNAIPDDHNHFFDVIGDDEHAGHGHDHGHDHHAHEVDPFEIIRKSVEIMAEIVPGFDIVYDVTGIPTDMVNGGELPVIVHLGSGGRFVRRFTGTRTALALEGMLVADFPELFLRSDGE